MYCLAVADGQSYVKISKSTFEDILDEYRCAGYTIDHVLRVIDESKICSIEYFAYRPESGNKEIGYCCCKY